MMGNSNILHGEQALLRIENSLTAVLSIQPDTAVAFEAMLSDRDGPTRPNENL